MSRFWKLYMLFFAIPFPMILYYSISSGMPAGESSRPWLALSLLLISILVWGILLYRYLQNWVLSVFKTRTSIGNLLRNGKRKEAKIIKAVKLSPAVPGVETVEVSVEMENFSGVLITEKLRINDSKPLEKRYEAGKTIKLRIDETLKSRPILIPESITVTYQRSKLALYILGWVLVCGAVAGYYVFSYWYESRGAGWRFLSFWHPLVLCPLILLFYLKGFSALMGKFFGTPKEALRLKYYGIRTIANILSAGQTGTYINEQPQVRFDLEFQDENGQLHNVSLKKVISLLNLNVARQESIEIFYLKENPQTIALASDLEDGIK